MEATSINEQVARELARRGIQAAGYQNCVTAHKHGLDFVFAPWEDGYWHADVEGYRDGGTAKSEAPADSRDAVVIAEALAKTIQECRPTRMTVAMLIEELQVWRHDSFVTAEIGGDSYAIESLFGTNDEDGADVVALMLTKEAK